MIVCDKCGQKILIRDQINHDKICKPKNSNSIEKLIKSAPPKKRIDSYSLENEFSDFSRGELVEYIQALGIDMPQEKLSKQEMISLLQEKT